MFITIFYFHCAALAKLFGFLQGTDEEIRKQAASFVGMGDMVGQGLMAFVEDAAAARIGLGHKLMGKSMVYAQGAQSLPNKIGLLNMAPPQPAPSQQEPSQLVPAQAEAPQNLEPALAQEIQPPVQTPQELPEGHLSEEERKEEAKAQRKAMNKARKEARKAAEQEAAQIDATNNAPDPASGTNPGAAPEGDAVQDITVGY